MMLARSHNELLALLDSSGNITERFVYGTKSNIPDYMYDSGGTEYKIVSNHLGSPVLVIKSSDGTIEEQITYDDYGNILTDSSPNFQPFGFAGCLWDNDTKLCHFGGGNFAGRDYDASVGRWTLRDPILFNGGDTNLFGYALQDPVNHFDTSGLDTQIVITHDSVAGITSSIGALSTLAYTFIKRTMKVHDRSLRLSEISILAKDATDASLGDATVTAEQRRTVFYASRMTLIRNLLSGTFEKLSSASEVEKEKAKTDFLQSDMKDFMGALFTAGVEAANLKKKV